MGGIPRSVHDRTVLRNLASRSGTVGAVFAASVQLSHGRGGKEVAHLLYVVVDIKDERPRDRGPLVRLLWTPLGLLNARCDWVLGCTCGWKSGFCTQECAMFFRVSEKGTIFCKPQIEETPPGPLAALYKY